MKQREKRAHQVLQLLRYIAENLVDQKPGDRKRAAIMKARIDAAATEVDKKGILEAYMLLGRVAFLPDAFEGVMAVRGRERVNIAMEWISFYNRFPEDVLSSMEQKKESPVAIFLNCVEPIIMYRKPF